jgi:hypothetical protein
LDADTNEQCIILQGTHNDTICVLRGYGYGYLTPLFNNISVISWRKVHNGGGNIMLYRLHIAMSGNRTHNFSQLTTIDRCKIQLPYDQGHDNPMQLFC